MLVTSFSCQFSQPQLTDKQGFVRKFLLNCFSICLLHLLCCANIFAAQSPVTIVDPDAAFQLLPLEYAEDASNELSVDQIRNAPFNSTWTPVLDKQINLGYQPNAFWYRFTIENKQDQAVERIIEIDFPLLDYVDLYRFNSQGLIESVQAGDRLLYDERPIDHANFLFRFELNAKETQELWLRVQTTSSHLVPLRLWEPDALLAHIGYADIVLGGYLGLAAATVIFYLFIFIALRESVHFYYAMALLLTAAYLATTQGAVYRTLLPNSTDLYHSVLLFLPPFAFLAHGLFVRQFLSLKERHRALYHLINTMIVVVVACFVVSFFLPMQTALQLVIWTATVGLSIALVIGPIAGLNGNRMGWVFTVAISALMLCSAASILSRQGFVPVTFVTEYGMLIGSTIEMLILSAVLAYKVHRQNLDKLEAKVAQLEENAIRLDAEERLLRASKFNQVSLLPNRSCFEQTLQEVILNSGNKRIAVVVIEITRYKEISKTLGHQNTDAMIHDAAQHHNALLSEVDGVIPVQGACLSSLEAESFGLLMEAQVNITMPHQIKYVLDELAKPIDFKGMQLELNSVAGIAICPDHGVNASTLMRHAQVAADSAEAEEYHVAYFKPELDQYNTRRLLMISELKEAIKTGQLELYLQPKYDTKAEKVTGVEALVRWNHPRYGIVRPDEFIPMAEETGVIKQLSRWAFHRALKQQHDLQLRGYDLSMSVNFSAENLREAELINYMMDELEEHEVDPSTIYIELTETAMMRNPREAIATLDKIRALGIRVSIDDFGSGYSSLAYLKTLPADEIKIDRSLIVEMAFGEGNDTVVRSTIDMCHELGFRVVAEGVESDVLLSKLSDLQCDLIQGYLFTPPLPHDRFIEWLENHQSNRHVS